MVWAGTAESRGYGSAWKKKRKRILIRDRYLCQPCLRTGRPTAATQVDHIVPKAKNGSDEDSNLEAICDACHTAKSLADKGIKPKKVIGLDGFPIEP